MNTTAVLVVTVCMFLVVSCALSERQQNEKKYRQFLAATGVDDATATQLMQNMSDEELAQAAKYTTTDGKVDFARLITDVKNNEYNVSPP